MIDSKAYEAVTHIMIQAGVEVTFENLMAAVFNRIVNLEAQVRQQQASLDEMLGAQRNFAEAVEDERF